VIGQLVPAALGGLLALVLFTVVRLVVEAFSRHW
jgi:hypothetical protein